MAEKTELCFVYGTLKRGLPNYPFWLDDLDCEFVGEAKTVNTYPLFVCTEKEKYRPGVSERPSEATGSDNPQHGHQIQGEVF
eukprot:gene8854-2929_t